MKTHLPPLRFEPIFRRYLWGGRRLKTLLDKPIGDGHDYAESWEVVDHGVDQSRVAYGEWAGTTLGELVRQHGDALLGRHAPREQFPLLFKFLDGQQRLSLQVHPNDAQAARLTPPDHGKTEAWVVLHAEPGAEILAGLKRGFDREAFERELRRGTGELCVHRFQPQVGDCVFIPAGVIHALGAGLVIAEIQQSSDVTFRLDDWGRLGPDGRLRALHVDQGLAVTDFDRGPIAPQVPVPTDQPGVEELVACEHFVLRRWRWQGGGEVGGDRRAHLLVVLAGEVVVAGDPAASPLRTGQVVLVPASLGRVTLHASAPSTMLQIYLP